jgi:hypothetical protein
VNASATAVIAQSPDSSSSSANASHSTSNSACATTNSARFIWCVLRKSGHHRRAFVSNRLQSPMAHGTGLPPASASSAMPSPLSPDDAGHASRPHALGNHARRNASQQCGTNATRCWCGGLWLGLRCGTDIDVSSPSSSYDSTHSVDASTTAFSASSAVSTIGGNVLGGEGVALAQALIVKEKVSVLYIAMYGQTVRAEGIVPSGMSMGNQGGGMW